MQNGGTSKFRFDDGVLIGAVIRKPSEVEELSLLPLHVIYAALATPSQALATAFGGPQADKVAVATKLGELSGKVKASEEKIQRLRAALMGSDIVSRNRSHERSRSSTPADAL
jgi:hypothetical protein